MKTAWLLHGTGGSDEDYFWFADTRAYLKSSGYHVWWPQLPHTDKPNLEETRNFIEDSDEFSWDEDTIIIGHSSACPVILDLLQHFKRPIKQAVLVAGFYRPINDDGYSELMLPDREWDWPAIKAAAKEIVFINSDNDPWGCDAQQARPTAEKLGAKFILAERQGHMGSISFDQPYREFPLLKALMRV